MSPPTERRKLTLVIHVDPANPVSVNKTCCYCSLCDLLIAHQDEVEAQLAVLFEQHKPELIGNDYLVLGTLDHEVWERGRQVPLTTKELLENLHVFREVLRISPADRKHRYGNLDASNHDPENDHYPSTPTRDRPRFPWSHLPSES